MHSFTELPLHGGNAPRWLFQRMVKLSRAISLAIIDEFGADELLARLSNSNWFQAFACAIGYDWHSSGTTTVTIAALREALNDTGEIYIAGGKGKAGTNTPNDIVDGVDVLSIPAKEEEFIEISRIAAKTDAAMLYDNVGIYHHSFIFTKSGNWAVVQQAISYEHNKAIRFHWFSELIDKKDIVNEPHSSIQSTLHLNSIDLTYSENQWVHNATLDILHDYKPEALIAYPSRHKIIPQIDISRKGLELIKKASDAEPEDYKDLLLVKGVGRSTLRSLAFLASLIYDKELASRDPVAYAYNLGGKDRIPFKINKRTYDSVAQTLTEIVERANIDKDEKYKALRRLATYLKS